MSTNQEKTDNMPSVWVKLNRTTDVSVERKGIRVDVNVTLLDPDYLWENGDLELILKSAKKLAKKLGSEL